MWCPGPGACRFHLAQLGYFWSIDRFLYLPKYYNYSMLKLCFRRCFYSCRSYYCLCIYDLLIYFISFYFFCTDLNNSYQLIWTSTCVMHITSFFFLRFFQHEIKCSHSCLSFLMLNNICCSRFKKEMEIYWIKYISINPFSPGILWKIGI